jgi:Peptidase A4 family/Putative Ig domain
VRTIRSLSTVVLALALALAGGAAAQAATPSAATPAASAHQRASSRPRPDAVTVPVQNLKHFSHLLNARHQALAATQTSTNWAGYAATGGTYTSVTSNWVEPSVSCTSDGIVAFWIGLDGWGSDTVEQDGTGVDCSSGSPEPFAWWETYPANSIQQYDEPVRAGDSLTSTVTYQSGGRYDLVLTDSTEGWTENNVVAAPSGASNASAEVVAEAVTSGSGVSPLPDFGSVRFADSTVDNGTLQAADAQAIDMTNSSGTVIAATGTDDSSGDFTVSYGSGTPTGDTVTVTPPGNQSSAVGAAADLQVSATDSAGAALGYTATGLPPKTSVSQSGLITGTLSTAGSYDVVVTATDSTGASGSASFVWTVGSGTTPPPTTCTGLAGWSASASYVPGDLVAYDGDQWTSTWYSTGAAPGAAGSWAVWQNDGAC